MGNKAAKKESNINLSSDSVLANSSLIGTPPTLLAWCKNSNDAISVIDLKTKQSYDGFIGAKTEHSSKYEIL